MLEVEAAIRNVMLDVKPHVVLTFDPHGALLPSRPSGRTSRRHRSILQQRSHG
jgi:hypothetical protein